MTLVLILRINQLVYQNQHHIMWRKLGCYEESKRKFWGVIPDKHQWCCMYPIDLDAAVDTKQILFGQILNLHDQQEPRYSRKHQQITSRKCLCLIDEWHFNTINYGKQIILTLCKSRRDKIPYLYEKFMAKTGIYQVWFGFKLGLHNFDLILYKFNFGQY